MGFGLTIGVLGVLILSHAAYSTIQYRGLLKITEDEFNGAPMNVVVELILGFLLCMYAGLTVPGNFQSIHPASKENSASWNMGYQHPIQTKKASSFDRFFVRELRFHDLQSSRQSGAFRF